MNTQEALGRITGGGFLEKIEKLALWQRAAIVAGVIAVFFGAATWLLYLPLYEEMETLEKNLETLEKKLATAKVNAAELEKFQAKMREAEAQFKIAMRALPDRQEIPALLTHVSKSGQEVGLEFLLFEPKPENTKEFYAEIPVAMSIRGDYHNMALFFDKVARLSRIVTIQNIAIQRGKDQRDLNANCTAVTYKFVEPPPEKRPPAPKPAAAKPAAPPAADHAPGKAKPKKLDF